VFYAIWTGSRFDAATMALTALVLGRRRPSRARRLHLTDPVNGARNEAMHRATPWRCIPRPKRSVVLALFGALAAAAPPAAAENVVVTIKPVHALVVEIMRGVAEPDLLVKGTTSPHTYALTPRDALALGHANVFIRVSQAIEPFTQRVIGALPNDVEVLTLMETPGLRLLAARRAPIFSRDAAPLGAYDPTRTDGHAWLDPANAALMVEQIARVLGRKDPANAALFRSHAEELERRLQELAAELDTTLKPVAGRPYILFHDALQYFERRFALNAVGAIALDPEVPPSGKRLLELRERIKSGGVVCVFGEPQFGARLVAALVEGTKAHVGTLDPEATTLVPGPELYFVLMRSLAAELTRCLSTPA
jgi:zinc transport system substrate-binding protein